jgi:hypothetical protein
MGRIPTAVAFIVFVVLAATFANVMTAPADGRGIALVAGLITTVILGFIVTVAFWLWSSFPSREAPGLMLARGPARARTMEPFR